jgi:hypothetical protein
VIGVGLNLSIAPDEFPPDLRHPAVSLFSATTGSRGGGGGGGGGPAGGGRGPPPASPLLLRRDPPRLPQPPRQS